MLRSPGGDVGHILMSSYSHWHTTACGTMTPNGQIVQDRPRRKCRKCTQCWAGGQLVKTCGTCRHYYAPRSLCEAPLPMWIEDDDPMGNFCGDDIRTQPADRDAETCRMYAKRHLPNVPVEARRKETP